MNKPQLVASQGAMSCISLIKMKITTLDRICSFLGELIGTALLIFLGCMGCVKTASFPNSHFQQTFNFGLVVMAAIQCFGCISGAHFNTAVSLAAYIYNLIDLLTFGIYFVAQMLGAFIGYGLLKALIPTHAITVEDSAHALCVTAPSTEITTVQAFFIEFIITGVLIAVCCAVWDPRNARYQDSVPVRFGLLIACLGCTAGDFTGASMNPARTFGPAVWNNDWDAHWIYWVAPLTSAFLTAFAYKIIFRRDLSESDKKLRAMEELPLS